MKFIITILVVAGAVLAGATLGTFVGFSHILSVGSGLLAYNIIRSYWKKKEDHSDE